MGQCFIYHRKILRCIAVKNMESIKSMFMCLPNEQTEGHANNPSKLSVKDISF